MSRLFRIQWKVFGAEIEDKADGYAKIIMGMKADIEALRAEEGRLAARRKGAGEPSAGFKEQPGSQHAGNGQDKV